MQLAIGHLHQVAAAPAKKGRCDSFMLGDYTECLSCEGAIIKPPGYAAIEDAKNELSNYAEDSGEYQIVKGDIERSRLSRPRLIDTVELLQSRSPGKEQARRCLSGSR
ncbi:hypothetical protein [Pseudomonas aeruginosa]|uniref:hypothetical protein n=1 Tax=Pseudomonas aeruginosa TaxID=287 RepID=UPI0031FE7D4A